MSTLARQPKRSSVVTRRLAWVLALALLLPFAQALAWVHTLSHHGTPRTDASAISAFDAPCAICLSAAPLHAGALPATAPQLSAPPLAHTQPGECLRTARSGRTTLAYLSRAPPLPLI